MSEVNNNDHQKGELPKSEKKGRNFHRSFRSPKRIGQKPEKGEQKPGSSKRIGQEPEGKPGSLKSSKGYIIGTTKKKGVDLLKKSSVKAKNFNQVRGIMLRKVQENSEEILEAVSNTMNVEAQKALDAAIAEFNQQQSAPSKEGEDAEGKPSR